MLKILWHEGSQTVDQVREALARADRPRELTHSSVSTMVNVMLKKKFLKRTKQGRSFVYTARVTEGQINRGMLGDLVDRVFHGSARTVMLELLETTDLDVEELKEIRRIINRKTKQL